MIQSPSERAKAYRAGRRGLVDRRCKLSWAQVDQIRALRGEGKSMQALADQFGVSKFTVVSIVNGKAWKR